MLLAAVPLAALRARQATRVVVTADIVAVAVAIATVSHARCTPRHVQTVATKLKYHSSLAKTAPFTVATAISHRVLPVVVVAVLAVVVTAAATVVDAALAGKHSNNP